MERIVEPELMTDADQARAYAAANFEEAHSRYPILFQKKFPTCPPTGHALDLGCGPGDVTRRFAAILPGWTFDAVDGSPAMLAEAVGRDRRARRVVGGSRRDRRAHPTQINYIEGFIPGAPIPRARYDLILSSSLLHHLHDPAVLWNTIRQHTGPGNTIFVVDLRRPVSRHAAERILKEQTPGEPEILRRDFFNSLLAAFTPAEIRAQLTTAGLGNLSVMELGDRHVCVWGTR